MHLLCICRPDWGQVNVNDAPKQIPKHMGGSTAVRQGLDRLADCQSHDNSVLQQENRSATDSKMTRSLSLWSSMGREWLHFCHVPWEMSEVWTMLYHPSSGLRAHRERQRHEEYPRTGDIFSKVAGYKINTKISSLPACQRQRQWKKIRATNTFTRGGKETSNHAWNKAN